MAKSPLMSACSRTNTKEEETMSVNKAILVGNLTKDPEQRFTGSGTAVCNFSLATNEKYKDKSGEWQERAEFHNIVSWSKLAEICGKYLKKGKQVYIEGRIQTRSYDDKSGNKKYVTEIVADQMQMLGGREAQGETKQEYPFNPDDESSIPF